MIIKRPASNKKTKHELYSLMNVGKKVFETLQLIGINSIKDLTQTSPDELYIKLENIRQKHAHPCVWDIFAAIIHEARTGKPMPWWYCTPMRKKKQNTMNLCNHTIIVPIKK